MFRFSGEMAEWLKAHAWKACMLQKGIEGSNPSLSASLRSQRATARQAGQTFVWSGAQSENCRAEAKRRPAHKARSPVVRIFYTLYSFEVAAPQTVGPKVAVAKEAHG